MGTCIEAVATARPRHFGRSALHLSDVAARRCLHVGHRHARELDLIVNIGLYKDHSLAEPALASLIQEDIGANPGHPPRGHHGTFSFDVLDGGCGMVTAARLIDGFVASSAVKLGMIVAADVDPAPGTSRRFPFVAAGGALLLSHSDHAGFVGFLTRTFAGDAGLFEVTMRWDPSAGALRHGLNVLEVHESQSFARHCIEHGIEVARALLDDHDLAPTDIDALVTSQYPHTFALGVARGVGIPPERLPHVASTLATAHTAGPIAGLEAALAASRPRHVLFVTAGAGITIATALYRSRE